jgi:formylglycine-generating enzyme required for sulfatase activity
MLSISVNVTTEQLRPLPKDRGVPTWLRRVIVRGLRVDPAARWDSMAALIRALETDPAVKFGRRVITGGAIAAVVVTVLVAWQWAARRRAEGEREIARAVDEAGVHLGRARAAATGARELRARAFGAFDSFQHDAGESAWTQTRAALPSADAAYEATEMTFERAYALDQTRSDIRDRLADARYEHLLFAEEFRMEGRAAVLLERLASVDADGRRRKTLTAPGTLTLHAVPALGHATLERYERDPATGRRNPKRVGPVRAAESAKLEPGSYRLVFEGEGLARVVYPFEATRGQQITVDLKLPPASSVPGDFVFVPAGAFWYGDADEQLRSQFLDTVPIHRRQTDAYLIAKHETTFAQWIAFLDAQPAAARAKLAPHVSSLTRGGAGAASLRMFEDDGGWRLEFQPTGRRYAARAGNPVVYVGRKTNVRQDWLSFPVSGISVDDAERYLAWLHETKRVPGARLCTDLEWERAARGADDRIFPHGDELRPDEANIDLTYGRVDSTYGPDGVGLHPASRSPFEIDDLAGNVLEFVASAHNRGEIVIRGGAYYFKPVNSRSTNRNIVPRTFRDVTTGFRVCAPVEERL